jgi:alkanesulfonate monooxygenase SsuD/methylene tetrahydromethanopterin reductase-like flavin-dependent oxidoreductase (luciferase family)
LTSATLLFSARPAVGTTISSAPGADPVAEARHAEALGFDLVTVHRDVLHGPPPSLETWTLLTWLAAHTSTVRLAPNVLALPNRHPAVVAKMAETLDRLSGGRLVLALGGGAASNGEAFGAFGLARRSAGETVAATEEVAKQLARLVRGGFSLLNLLPAGDGTEQRERLARQVLPILRAEIGSRSTAHGRRDVPR